VGSGKSGLELIHSPGILQLPAAKVKKEFILSIFHFSLPTSHFSHFSLKKGDFK